MEHLKTALEARGFVLNPPASPDDLAALEADLGAPLPLPVRAMYEQFDGLEVDDGLVYQPLSARRAKNALADLRAPYEDLGTPGLLRFGVPVFRDAGDNYLVYSLLPECPDRLIFSEHDGLFEPDVWFPTLEAVFEVGHDATTDAWDMPPTYPAIAGTVPGDDEAADACLTAWRSRGGLEGQFFLSLACDVLPRSREGELTEWLAQATAEELRPIYRSLGARAAPGAAQILEALLHRVKAQGGAFAQHTRWIVETLAELETPEAAEALQRWNAPSPRSG